MITLLFYKINGNDNAEYNEKFVVFGGIGTRIASTGD